MTELLTFIQTHIEYAPFIIFSLLILAGFNIPVSEDGMLFIAAFLASQSPEHWPLLYASVYLGAYFSDLICYGLGRIIGPRLLDLKFFAGMARRERIDKIHAYYDRYGVITLILGRFIPFGVRNGLFLTAGLAKMNLIKFAAADLLACTISTASFFTLYYRYGEQMIEMVRKANIAIFILALAVGGYFYFRRKNPGRPNQP
ncbi:DedA family protein [Methylomonas sp. LL1]|uniref:DedA family protein n=1 Tax=Methylomonas sp. LL1 TaxID=2785785 RepID=UPI0018C3976A|nr:DedA family protein [Methylomonas sp. LL1]QPK64495.1 DedA family protein [Methylomonas sp. LL1]